MNKRKTIRLAIADDHNLFREGLVTILNSYKGIKVVISAANGKELLDEMAHTKTPPDVCIVDINMPVMHGYDTVMTISTDYPHIRILALSMYDDEINIIRMIRNGANGYLLKDCMPSVLVDAIKDVYEEGTYHSELVTRKVLKDSKTKKIDKKDVLTAKELNFLKLACSEKTYKEIAEELGVSERTIDGYRDRLFTKLGVRSRTGLVIYGLRNSYIDLYTSPTH